MMTLIQPCFLWEEWESGAGLGVRTVFYDGPFKVSLGGIRYAEEADLMAHARAYGNA